MTDIADKAHQNYTAFLLAVQSSETTCKDLYEMRTRIPKGTGEYRLANAVLRDVGCTTPNGTRRTITQGKNDEICHSYDMVKDDPDGLYEEAGTTDPMEAAHWYSRTLVEEMRPWAVMGAHAALTGQPMPVVE